MDLAEKFVEMVMSRVTGDQLFYGVKIMDAKHRPRGYNLLYTFICQPEFGNQNGHISHLHDILDESPAENTFLCSSNCFVDDYFEYLTNIPHSTLQTSEHCGFENLINSHSSTSQTSEDYGFGDLTNSPHTSQTIIPQDIDHMNNAMLLGECLKQGSKMVHHLTLLEHRNLTSPIVNECLKNLLVTLQSQSSQLEELSGEQSIDLESLPMDQLSAQYWTASQAADTIMQ
ncbi:9037_t:CDS:2 [Cetraspora pellucida]|uniref:9037_t:CDS:1 n=1 Tax=Cetraspora pellucida TaxID=1433469 RepID=A0ACA9K3J1_9GLOM|nr:9037_t:CDS:2 [Cetraspora pellucida]